MIDGYGVCNIPLTAGEHEIKCPIWRVVGNTMQELYAYFLGIMPQMRNLNLISKELNDERKNLVTISIGFITLNVNVLVRNFDKFNLEWE